MRWYFHSQSFKTEFVRRFRLLSARMSSAGSFMSAWKLTPSSMRPARELTAGKPMILLSKTPSTNLSANFIAAMSGATAFYDLLLLLFWHQYRGGRPRIRLKRPLSDYFFETRDFSGLACPVSGHSSPTRCSGLGWSVSFSFATPVWKTGARSSTFISSSLAMQ